MRKSLLLSATLLPLMAPPALSEQDPLVITITGYTVTAEEALVPVEVFDRQQIEDNNGGDLSDLLRMGNGLELGRNGGPGQFSSMFFRGTNSDHNLVLVNGVSINSATLGNASIGTLDTQLLQRVDIIKGPQSTLWGSGAIGGVTSISTLPDRTAPNGFSGSASYGSHNTLRLAANTLLGDDDNRINLGLALQDTDGFPTLKVSDIDSAYTNTSVNLAATHDAGAVQLEAAHWQTQGESEYLAYTYPAPTFSLVLAPVSQDFVTSVSSLGISGRLAGAIDSSLQLSQARDHIDQNDNSDFAHTDRTSLSWRNSLALAGLDKLSFGAQASWERASSMSFGTAYSGTTDFQEIYAQYNANRDRHDGLAGVRLLQHEDAGTHVTWNLGYGYRLDEATRLKANLATGFRYPTAAQRFGFGANPNLRPEESRSLELGVFHRMASGQTVQLSLFDTRIDDLIFYTGVFPLGRNENIEEARIRGIDAAYDLLQGPWGFHAGLLLQDPQNVSDNTRLLRRARVSAKSRLSYTQDKLHTGLEAIYSGERDDVDAITFAPTTTGAYALVNLFGSYDLDRKLQLFAKLDNLFDRDYEVVSGYNTPGRSLFVGVRYRPE